MKAIFVNRYFHPDHSATSQLLSELAFDLAVAGRDVHIVTSRQLYEVAKANLPPYEVVSNVHIHRVWTTRFGRANLAGRSLDYITFYVTAFFALSSLLNRGDVVVAKTDPPLISLVAAAAARIRGAVLVNWIQDLFPEVAERLGVRLFRWPLGPIARGLRNLTLRQASTNVVLGERMATLVEAVDATACVIHNWADGGAIQPMPAELSDLHAELGVNDRFVVAYSGNMGRAHDFETILKAIVEFKEDEDVLFLFIGGGNQARTIREAVDVRGLSARVVFCPYQPKQRLGHSLAAGHVHLVTLRPTLEGLIVPSKFYGVAAAGRPTLFVGDRRGEIALLLSHFDCGYTVQAGESAELAHRIRQLRDDPLLRTRLGANARAALTQHFNRPLAVNRWQEVLTLAEMSRVGPNKSSGRPTAVGNPTKTGK